MRTFEQTQEEEAERIGDETLSGGEEKRQLRDKTDIEIKTVEELVEQFEDITRPNPDDLGEAEQERQLPSRPRQDFSGINQVLQELGVNLDQLSGKIQDISDVNLSGLDVEDLLRLLIRLTVAQFRINRVIAVSNVAQTDTIFNIADYTSPFSSITVSGINSISNSSGDPEVVVPQSDSQDVATKNLFMRASRDNDEPIAIGDSKVSPSSGFLLYPGEYKALSVDLREQVLWMAADDSGQVVELLGVF